jgi:hypothetical protein
LNRFFSRVVLCQMSDHERSSESGSVGAAKAVVKEAVLVLVAEAVVVLVFGGGDAIGRSHGRNGGTGTEDFSHF